MTALLSTVAFGLTAACSEPATPPRIQPIPTVTVVAPPSAARTVAAVAPPEVAVPQPTATPSPLPSATTVPASAPPPVAAPAPPPAAVPAPAAAPKPPSEAQVPTYVPAPTAGAVAVRPRAFRTPERDAPQPFQAPQGGADTPVGEAGSGVQDPVPGIGAAPSRSTAGVVVFRTTARTALEGFDLRVTYPRSLGTFASKGEADCNAGTGALVAASDRGNGELRLLVASAQPLPFPLDVFCRFGVAAGAGLDAGAFAVRVAEVTSDGKRADTSLLLVDVVVR